jgi:hypothetical protein
MVIVAPITGPAGCLCTRQARYFDGNGGLRRKLSDQHR